LILVTKDTDDGKGDTEGTLSWAIDQANIQAGADTISLQNNVRLNFGDTLLPMVTLIDSDITFKGNGYTISGDNNNNNQVDEKDRPIFFVKSGNITFNDLTLKGGVAKPGAGAAGMGGGLFIYGGDVTLNHVVLDNNQALGSSRTSLTRRGLGGLRDVWGIEGVDGDRLGDENHIGGNGGNGSNGGAGGNGGIGGKMADGGIGGNGGIGATGGIGGTGGRAGKIGNGRNTGGNGGNGGFGGIGGNGGTPGSGSSNYGNSGIGGFGTGTEASAGMGGAIFIRSGSLNINNGSSLTNNHANGGNGGDDTKTTDDGQGFGGAIFALTQATIDAQKALKASEQDLPASNELPVVNISSDTTFSDNSASDAATKTQEVKGTDLNTDAIFARTTEITTPTPNAPTTPAQITQTVKAKGQDGPIAGGTVFLDVNGNGIQDSGEPTSTTDAAGNFTLEIAGDFDTNGNGILDPEEGQYVIVGGTDAITGQAFTGILKAVPGSTMVTPLTTLVATLVDTGLTPEEAQTLVKTSLGLPSAIDLATFDPIAAAQEGSSEALAVLAAQVAVQTTMTQLSASYQTINPTADVNTLTNSLVYASASAISQGSLNLSDPNQIQTLLNDAISSIDSTQLNPEDSLKLQQISSNVAQLSQVIAASNQQILTATTTDGIFQAQKVAQTSVTQDLIAAFSGTKSFSEVVANNTGAALTAQIATATIDTSVIPQPSTDPNNPDTGGTVIDNGNIDPNQEVINSTGVGSTNQLNPTTTSTPTPTLTTTNPSSLSDSIEQFIAQKKSDLHSCE
jgi:hypothetical protein